MDPIILLVVLIALSVFGIALAYKFVEKWDFTKSLKAGVWVFFLLGVMEIPLLILQYFGFWSSDLVVSTLLSFAYSIASFWFVITRMSTFGKQLRQYQSSHWLKIFIYQMLIRLGIIILFGVTLAISFPMPTESVMGMIGGI